MNSYSDDVAISLTYDMTAIICDVFQMEEKLAAHLANQITDGLRARMGGQSVYIPAKDKRARNDAIRREFNGTNLAEICKRYNLSKTRVYEITGK